MGKMSWELHTTQRHVKKNLFFRSAVVGIARSDSIISSPMKEYGNILSTDFLSRDLLAQIRYKPS